MSIPEQYVWLIWAGAFLVPWLILYWCFPRFRRSMLWASIFTTPFGLTEPLFVPEYWTPPSLFNLAVNTGFDIESLIFCFGIGGVATVLYNLITGKTLKTVSEVERLLPLHRHHYKVLAAPFVVFVPLYFIPWNPIYAGIAAMIGGAVTAMWCRPDLKAKTWIGGLLFTAYYAVFLWALELTVPGYIERVWNMDALTGISILALPLEEILFAFTFGMYWSGVYEHFTWRRSV